MRHNLASRVHNGADIIDSRDVIERIAELEADLTAQHESERDDYELNHATNPRCVDPGSFEEWLNAEAEGGNDDATDLIALRALADQCDGYGDWSHGETLIRDTYFVTYAQELAEDIDAIQHDAQWPNNHIDWEAAADALKADYMSVDYDGVEYWIRA